MTDRFLNKQDIIPSGIHNNKEKTKRDSASSNFRKQLIIVKAVPPEQKERKGNKIDMSGD